MLVETENRSGKTVAAMILEEISKSINDGLLDGRLVQLEGSIGVETFDEWNGIRTFKPDGSVTWTIKISPKVECQGRDV